MTSHTSLYREPSTEELKKEFVGRNIKDFQTPAAILDVSKVKDNCERMLDAVKSLSMGWRVHIKTHKTEELTKLQVGEGTGPVNIIASTILEVEKITPLLLSYKSQGRDISILYGFPVTPSAVLRLSAISKTLGPGGLSLIIDHPAQLPTVSKIAEMTGYPPCIFIKIDMGAQRCGVIPQTPAAKSLIALSLALEGQGHAVVLGLYAHAGHSYSGSSRTAALDYLRQELEALFVSATDIQALIPNKKLILSAGATPTATSMRNLLANAIDTPEDAAKEIAAIRATMETIRAANCEIEVHAGVYPILDVQQLATHALPMEGPKAMLTWQHLAVTVLAEVASLYPGRGGDGKDEVLVGAGSLAIGREPCKAYSGWGVVSPWNIKDASWPKSGPEDINGWYLGKVSQEHGILRWGGNEPCVNTLEIGQKIRIWPNHACIAIAGHSRLLIVDSTREGKEDEIIDVWPSWRGW